MVDFLPQLRRDPLNTLKVIKETNPVLRDIFEAIPIHERVGATCPTRGSEIKKWLQNWGLAQKGGATATAVVDENKQFSPNGRRPLTAGSMRSPPQQQQGREGDNDGSMSARGPPPARGRISGGVAAPGPPAGGNGLSRSPTQPQRSLHAASPPPQSAAAGGMMSPRGRFHDDNGSGPSVADDYGRPPPQRHAGHERMNSRGGYDNSYGNNNNNGIASGYDRPHTPPVGARPTMSPHAPPANAWGAPHHDDGYGHGGHGGTYNDNRGGFGGSRAAAPSYGGGHHHDARDEGEAEYDQHGGAATAAAGPCQACRQKEATIKRLTQLVNELLSQIEDVAMEARGDLTFALQGVGMAAGGAAGAPR